MVLDDFKDLLATCASVCQILQILSGVLVCRKFIKKGSSNDISHLPFSVGTWGFFMWLNYGLIIKDSAVTYVNFFGFLFFASYIVAYCIFYTNRIKLLKELTAISVAGATILFLIRSIEDTERRRTTLGFVCSGLSICFFAAPLASLTHVIRVKSSESLPFPIILMSLVVTSLWCSYGYVLKDKFIVYPNFLAFLLSCFQMSLFAIYPSR